MLLDLQSQPIRRINLFADHGAHLNAASPMDGPLSLRYDESDGIAVFDDVMVPWERVFLFRDKEAEAVIRGKTGAGPHALHQSVVRAVRSLNL